MCNFRELMFGTNFPLRVVTKTCQPTPSPSNYVTISDIHSSNRQRNVHICSGEQCIPHIDMYSQRCRSEQATWKLLDHSPQIRNNACMPMG